MKFKDVEEFKRYLEFVKPYKQSMNDFIQEIKKNMIDYKKNASSEELKEINQQLNFIKIIEGDATNEKNIRTT